VRVAAAITPFNHPLNQVLHKVAPAIAAGTPMVLKPSERTPLSALWLLDVLAECGLPHDALQMVTGDPREIGAAMLEHPSVDVVLFTGSVAVGKHIAANLGYRRAVLELGGNDPLLVLDGARIERAAELAVAGAFANSGQRCTARQAHHRPRGAGRRARGGHRRGHGAACGRRSARRAHRCGHADRRVGGRDRGATRATCDRLRRASADRRQPARRPDRALRARPRAAGDDARRRGDVRAGGADPARARADEAIALANATPYGLSSGVVTGDLELALRCARELRCGTVNIDEVPGYRTELTPFGGIGDSGLGVKEGVRESIRALTVGKLVSFPWG
jgi:aldehyde dehydrogenase (NAD+)